MKVVLTGKARADLIRIADHIAEDSPRRATSFVRELVASARQIGETPYGYALLPDYADHGIRRKPHRAYTIFYWIVDGRVDVLHILHSARDYEAILFADDADD